jgi:hypothetical protein
MMLDANSSGKRTPAGVGVEPSAPPSATGPASAALPPPEVSMQIGFDAFFELHVVE